jgi:hypothetical protein
VNWSAISAIGSVLSGLAVVIAFYQLGSQREDKLRAQISKIGVWAQADHVRIASERAMWQITLFVKNASELPIEVHVAELAIDTLGYKNVRGSAAGGPPQTYADKRTGPTKPAYFFPGTVPPGHKWHGEQEYTPVGDFDRIEQIRIGIFQLAITDAAGLQWDVRPSLGRTPRRIRWQREWPWRRGTMPPPGASKE